MRSLIGCLLLLGLVSQAAQPGDPQADFDKKLADARAAKSQADTAAAQARDEMQRARGAADQAAKEAKAAKGEADRKAREAAKAKTADKKLKQAVADEARKTHDRIDRERAALRKAADAAKSRYDQLAAQAQGAARRLDDLLAAAPLPMSGFPVPELRAFDDAMQKFMRERSIKAGTLAVMKDGRVVLARSYGYLDGKRTLTLGPDPPLRIASISKPITAAAILKLIREGKLKLDDKAFVLLAVQPPAGRKADPRLADITIRHLLDHQGGWDKEATFDPMFQSAKIAAALGKRSPASANDIVTYMAGQPLQFTPGSQTKYSNFGYCVLGRVVEKVTGKRYVDYVSDDLLYPLKIKSVELGRSLPRDRNPRESFYFDPKQAANVMEPDSPAKVPWPDGGFCLEAMDAHGGLIASAADLVRFAEAYTIKGEPRTSGSRRPGLFVAKGSLPGTAGALVWREDGVSLAALFNQRTGPSGQPFENTIARVLNQVADAIKTWPAPR